MGEDGGGQRKYSDDEAYEKRSGWWQTVLGCIVFSETVVTKYSLRYPYVDMGKTAINRLSWGTGTNGVDLCRHDYCKLKTTA